MFKPASRFFSPDPARRPLIIAHRGGSLEAPENTLAALSRAIRLGADWQEVDVTLTSDGQAVILHDDDLDRTTDGAGPVSQYSFEEIRKLQAGRPRWSESGRANLASVGVKRPRKFAGRYMNERIPTLEEVLRLKGMQLMLELKKVDRPVKLVDETLRTIAALGCRDRVGIASFEYDLLRRVNQADPRMPLIGLCEGPKDRPLIASLPLTVLATWTEDVAAARAVCRPGTALWTWTSYTPAMADAQWRAGVDGVITDAPRRVIHHPWPAKEGVAAATPFGTVVGRR